MLSRSSSSRPAAMACRIQPWRPPGHSSMLVNWASFGVDSWFTGIVVPSIQCMVSGWGWLGCFWVSQILYNCILIIHIYNPYIAAGVVSQFLHKLASSFGSIQIISLEVIAHDSALLVIFQKLSDQRGSMCDNGLSETCWMRKRGSCHFDLFRAI